MSFSSQRTGMQNQEVKRFGLEVQNKVGERLGEICQENALVIANTLFQQHKRRLYIQTSSDGQYQIRLIIFFAAKDGKALYSQQKQDWELTVAQIMNFLSSNSAILISDKLDLKIKIIRDNEALTAKFRLKLNLT